eukprot:2811078-Pyramimonas_sp.AAC.1
MAAGAVNAKKLLEWKEGLNQKSLMAVSELFPFVKVQGVLEEGSCNIVIFQIVSLNALVKCLVQLGFEKKIGIAPMSHIVRVLQSMLESGMGL